jgi:hypothetical protein
MRGAEQMDALDKCKATIRAAIEELERNTGHSVLAAQMVALKGGASPTYVNDPDAVVRTIAVSLRASESLRLLPWLEE